MRPRAVSRVTLAIWVGALVLVGVVLSQTDLGETAASLARLRWPAVGLLALVFAAGLAAEVTSWMLAMPSVPYRPRWIARVTGALLYGSAIEMVTPLGSFGGEPVKVAVLRRHGVPIHEAVASVVLSRLTDVIALVAFLAIGVWLMLRSGTLPLHWELAGLAGLAALVVAGALFFRVQHRRPLSRLGAWLAARWPLRGLDGVRSAALLQVFGDVDRSLAAFHRAHRWRLALSSAASLGEWAMAAASVYVAVAALGEPVGAAEAITVQALVLLVRAVFFFVPADVGTQEGAFVLAGGMLLGSPALGLALAAIHRARDVAVVLVGIAVGGLHAWPRRAEEAVVRPRVSGRERS
jgi:glycosyltransferase 2 family protein